MSHGYEVQIRGVSYSNQSQSWFSTWTIWLLLSALKQAYRECYSITDHGSQLLTYFCNYAKVQDLCCQGMECYHPFFSRIYCLRHAFTMRWLSCILAVKKKRHYV